MPPTPVPPAFVPNAGTVLRIYAPPATEPALPDSRVPLPAVQPDPAQADATPLRVERVTVEGASLLPAADLDQALAGLAGRQATLGELRAAADRITALYRERGYFLARAYLPAQDVTDGIVRVAVLEGRYDQVQAAPSARLSPRTISAVLRAHAVATGQPVAQAPLERSLILLEEGGAAPVRAQLQPGATPGTSTLLIQTPSGPALGGSIGVDNYGNRFTGEARLTASLMLDSPLGQGDHASLWLAHSSGADAAFAAWQVPLGGGGLTIGASGSYYRYGLCCQFAPLERAGEASVGGLQARYPLRLGQQVVAWAGLAFEHKRLEDRWTGGLLDDKRASVVTASVDGVVDRDGRRLRYRVAASAGELDLRGPADAVQANAATLDTAGRYARLWASANQTLPLWRWSFLDLGLGGQLASRNLDASEKFLLGGYGGIRAYPEGEAAGDNAWLARLDWVVPLPAGQHGGSAAIRAFVDTGAVWIVDDLRDGRADPGFRNHYALSGAGVGFDWNLPRGRALSTYVARQIGDNPGASASGNDADGRDRNVRAWIGAQWAF